MPSLYPMTIWNFDDDLFNPREAFFYIKGRGGPSFSDIFSSRTLKMKISLYEREGPSWFESYVLHYEDWNKYFNNITKKMIKKKGVGEERFSQIDHSGF